MRGLCPTYRAYTKGTERRGNCLADCYTSVPCRMGNKSHNHQHLRSNDWSRDMTHLNDTLGRRHTRYRHVIRRCLAGSDAGHVTTIIIVLLVEPIWSARHWCSGQAMNGGHSHRYLCGHACSTSTPSHGRSPLSLGPRGNTVQLLPKTRFRGTSSINLHHRLGPGPTPSGSWSRPPNPHPFSIKTLYPPLHDIIHWRVLWSAT